MFLALHLTLGVWVVLEFGLRLRDRAHHRGGRDRDRGTRILIGLAIGSAIAVAFIATPATASLPIAGPHRAVGVLVIWIGLAIRVWAIATLADAFRTTVEVDPGQPVIRRGPYARIRHPSYTGLLLIMTGLGIALGNWPATAICVILPLAALLRRIHVEEAELTKVLGAPYVAYCASTSRIIPGIW